MKRRARANSQGMRQVERERQCLNSVNRVNSPVAERGCTSKSQFATKQRAKIIAIKMTKLHGVQTRQYKCKFCRAFHLTTTGKKKVV